MTIAIRQAVAADRPAIESFDAAHYAEYAPYKDHARFQWQYIDNPCRPPGGALPVWLAFDDGKLVGHIGVQLGNATFRGISQPVGWMVDLLIDPAYRGRQIAQRLYEASRASAPILLALTMAPAFRRMGEKQGCLTLAPLARYTRLLHATPEAMRRYVLNRTRHRRHAHRLAHMAVVAQLHRLAAPVVNLIRGGGKVDSAAKYSEFSIEPVQTFPPEAAELCDRLQQEHAATTLRTLEYLNWRFANCPRLDYKIFLLRHAGVLRGYSVLRTSTPPELPLGNIVDLVASRNDAHAYAALIDHAVRHFRGNAAAVQCVAGDAALSNALAAAGFRRTEVMHPTCLCRDDAVRGLCAAAADDWFFSAADHDLDQVWAVPF